MWRNIFLIIDYVGNFFRLKCEEDSLLSDLMFMNMNSYIEKETGIQFFIFLPNINFLYKNILILKMIYNVSLKNHTYYLQDILSIVFIYCNKFSFLTLENFENYIFSLCIS